MSNISPTTAPGQFWVGNHLYQLDVGIDDGHGKNNTLDTQCIELFSYNNQMNRLYLTGYLEYVDNSSVIERFIDSDDAMINIGFSYIQTEKNGKIENQKEKKCLDISFYIDGVEILSNIPGQISYRLNLIGTTYLKLAKQVQWTNYGDEKKTPSEIIQTFLKEYIGLEVDDQTFKDNATTPKFNYITTMNDTGFSTIKYLMNRTIYDPKEYDKSVNALVIDEKCNKVFMFGTGIYCDSLGVYQPITIEVVKNEKFPGYQSPTKIGYTNKFSRKKALLNTRAMTYHSYNMEADEFTKETIETTDFMNILNGGVENKSSKYVNYLTDRFMRDEAEWNNDIDLYSRLFETITQTNGLITNQDGDIGVIPGYACEVTVPNSNFPKLNTQTNTTKYEESQYQSITGGWNVFEVEHYISPMRGLFRQKLILYRVHN